MIEAKEVVVSGIISMMQEALGTVQLQILENAIRVNLRGIKLEEECTELSTYTDDNDNMIKVFAGNKKLEGCKIGSIKQYVRHTRNFLQEIDKNYKYVTKDDVKIYLAQYSMRVKQNTVINAKRFLSTFFSWAHEEGYIYKNPVKAIKGMKPVDVETKYLSVEEEVSIRDVEKSLRDTAIIDFLLSTGVRVGEIEMMNLNNVNLRDGSVTFIGEKNYKERTVYLDVRAKKHLVEYLESRNDNNTALFISHRLYSNIYDTKETRRLGKAAYENITKSICVKAGIVDKICTVHVFRKTFATRLADKGCPLEIIQELLGHADASTTSKHYVAKSRKRVKLEFDRFMNSAA